MRKSKVKLLMPYQKRESIKIQTRNSKFERDEFWHDLIYTTIRNVISACALGALGLAVVGFAFKASLSTPVAIWYGFVGLILATLSIWLLAWPILHSGVKLKLRMADRKKMKFINLSGAIVFISVIYMVLVPVLDVSSQITIENIKSRSNQESVQMEQGKKLDKILEIVAERNIKTEAPK